MSQLNTIEARITQKSGTVYVEREGERLTLEIGDAIYESDLIITGPDTTAEIQYIDGTMSRLAPETQMRLVDFEYDATVNSENSFLVDIAEGAMRTVTGEIVKLNPDAFEIVTPRATVGIRGTDIATQINDDGSETHVVISIGKGHRVEITTHDGQLMSLYSSNEGAFIPVDLGGEIKPYIFNFTTEEINEIINHIENAVSDEQIKEDEEGLELEQDHSSIIIDQTTIDALGTEIIEALTNSLESAGLTVLLPEETLALETVENETILVPGEPDGPDGASGASGPSGPTIDALGFTVVDYNPSASYYADSEIVDIGAGNTSTATKTRLNLTASLDNNVTISGDVGTISSGIVQAAGDIITGSAMSNGRVVGDANEVFAGELRAGDDQITFDSKTGGTSIYGDAANIYAAARVTFGDDTITIKGDFTNSLISGDASSIDGTVDRWGNDHIIIEGNMASPTNLPTIYGDSGNLSEGGNDTIEIRGTLDAASGGYHILAGGGNDDIQIGLLTQGAIDGGIGDDTLTLTKSGSHNLADVINVESIVLTQVASTDVITGSSNADNIEVLNHTGGTINLGDGDDNITVKNLNGITINGGGGTDSITVAEGGNHNFTGFGAGAGNIPFVEHISFSDADDTIEVLAFLQGINGGGGTDIINVQGNGGTFIVGTFEYSNIEQYNFTAGADNITVKNPISGTFALGDEADSIRIELGSAYSGITVDFDEPTDPTYGEVYADTITIVDNDSTVNIITIKDFNEKDIINFIDSSGVTHSYTWNTDFGILFGNRTGTVGDAVQQGGYAHFLADPYDPTSASIVTINFI